MAEYKQDSGELASPLSAKECIDERGLSIIGGGGRTSAGSRLSVVLYAIRGWDWIGEAYDVERSRRHQLIWEAVNDLDGKPGRYLVHGSEVNPAFSWPVWARVGPAR